MLKRITCMLLVIVLIVGMLPVTARTVERLEYEAEYLVYDAEKALDTVLLPAYNLDVLPIMHMVTFELGSGHIDIGDIAGDVEFLDAYAFEELLINWSNYGAAALTNSASIVQSSSDIEIDMPDAGMRSRSRIFAMGSSNIDGGFNHAATTIGVVIEHSTALGAYMPPVPTGNEEMTVNDEGREESFIPQFLGWNTMPDGSGINIDASTVITEDMTLYGQWEISPLSTGFFVTFMLNQAGAGTLEPGADVAAGIGGTREIQPGGTISSLPMVPYHGTLWFIYWNTIANGTGVMVTPQLTHPVANRNVHGQWGHRLTFNVEGQGQVADIRVVRGMTVNNTRGPAVAWPADPAPPTGYSFTGWYSALSGGIRVTPDRVINQDYTLHARFVHGVVNHQVTFSLSGGVLVGANESNIRMARHGRSIAQSGVIPYNLNQGVPAGWRLSAPQVNWPTNGAVPPMSPVIPVQPQRHVAGWHTASGDWFAPVGGGQTFNEARALITAPITVYPDWQHRVIFDPSGSTPSWGTPDRYRFVPLGGTSTVGTHGTHYALVSLPGGAQARQMLTGMPTPVWPLPGGGQREFLGWFQAANAQAAQTGGIRIYPHTPITASMTLFARWGVGDTPITVTFHPNGGRFICNRHGATNSTLPRVVTPPASNPLLPSMALGHSWSNGNTVMMPLPPVHNTNPHGYVFYGWFLSPTLPVNPAQWHLGRFNSSTSMGTGYGDGVLRTEYTLYARWVPAVRVHFDHNHSFVHSAPEFAWQTRLLEGPNVMFPPNMQFRQPLYRVMRMGRTFTEMLNPVGLQQAGTMVGQAIPPFWAGEDAFHGANRVANHNAGFRFIGWNSHSDGRQGTGYRLGNIGHGPNPAPNPTNAQMPQFRSNANVTDPAQTLYAQWAVQVTFNNNHTSQGGAQNVTFNRYVPLWANFSSIAGLTTQTNFLDRQAMHPNLVQHFASILIHSEMIRGVFPTQGNFTHVGFDIGMGFVGWHTSPNGPAGGGNWVTADTIITGPTTLYAQWGAGEHLFLPGIAPASSIPGGSVSVPFEANQPIEPFPQDPVWEGRTFLGWFRDGDSTQRLQPGVAQTTRGTFHALWAVVFSLDTQGGVFGGPQMTEINIPLLDTGAIDMPVGYGYPSQAITRPGGWAHAGWFDHPAGIAGSIQLTPQFRITESVTFYAQWNTTVTFILDGGGITGETVSNGRFTRPASRYRAPIGATLQGVPPSQSFPANPTPPSSDLSFVRWEINNGPNAGQPFDATSLVMHGGLEIIARYGRNVTVEESLLPSVATVNAGTHVAGDTVEIRRISQYIGNHGTQNARFAGWEFRNAATGAIITTISTPQQVRTEGGFVYYTFTMPTNAHVRAIAIWEYRVSVVFSPDTLPGVSSPGAIVVSVNDAPRTPLPTWVRRGAALNISAAAADAVRFTGRAGALGSLTVQQDTNALFEASLSSLNHHVELVINVERVSVQVRVQQRVPDGLGGWTNHGPLVPGNSGFVGSSVNIAAGAAPNNHEFENWTVRNVSGQVVSTVSNPSSANTQLTINGIGELDGSVQFIVVYANFSLLEIPQFTVEVRRAGSTALISHAALTGTPGISNASPAGTFTVIGAMVGETLTATATGFMATNNTHQLTGSEVSPLIIYLQPIANHLNFTVEVRSSATGNALIGHATLTRSGTAVTGSNGVFAVAGATAGQDLVASATGFGPRTVTLQGNESGTITILLDPVSLDSFTVEVRNSASVNPLIGHAVLTGAGTITPVAGQPGRFTVAGATAGQGLVASATGFSPRTVTLQGNESGTVIIQLDPIGLDGFTVEVRYSGVFNTLIGHATLTGAGTITPIVGQPGRFTVAGATAGQTLAAGAIGFTQNTRTVLGNEAGTVVILLDALPVSHTFTVEVRTGSETGPMVEHATLTHAGTAVSGSGGVFSVMFPTLGGAVGQQLVASADGFSPQTLTVQGTESGTVVIVLEPIAGHLNFTVEVRAGNAGGPLIGHATLTGAGTIEPIEGQPGRFTVTGATAGQGLAASATGFSPRTVTLQGNESGTITILLDPIILDSFTVEVRSSAPGNAPIGHATLTRSSTEVSGSNGVFTITGAMASQDLVASATGFSPRTVTLLGNESGTIVIYLDPTAIGSFMVQVRSSAAGNALIGHAALTQNGTAVTGSGGVFTITGAMAGQDLVASATGFSPRTVTLQGNEPGTLIIQLDPIPINFTVEVRNAAHNNLINHATLTQNGTEVSGSNGVFTITGAMAGQDIVASATGFSPRTRTLLGTETGTLVILLDPTDLESFTVEVRSSATGNALIGHAALTQNGTVVSGSGGVFDIVGAAAGQNLVASATGFSPRTVTLLGNESGIERIYLDPIPGAINFAVRVVNSVTSAPITHAELAIGGTVIAGSNGLFTVVATAGDVVVASAAGFVSYSVTLVGTESGMVEIALAPTTVGIAFNVEIRNQAGALIPHAELTVTPERPSAITANGDGTFTVAGVRALDILNASATWFGPDMRQVLGNEGGTTVVINLTQAGLPFTLATSNFPQGLQHIGQGGVANNAVGQPEAFVIPGERPVLDSAGVTLNAGTVTDWTFLGWFRIANLPQQHTQVPVPSQNYVEFAMPTHAVHYVAVWGDQNGIVGQRNSHQLTISNMPASVEPVNQMASGPRPAQQPVVLASGFAENWTFLGWWQGANAPTSGNISELDGNPQFLNNAIMFNMPSAAETLTALWGNNGGDIGVPNSFTLIVTVEGPDAGTAFVAHETATFTNVGNVFTAVTPMQLSGSVTASALGFVTQSAVIPTYVDGVARLTITMLPFIGPVNRIEGRVTRADNGAPISGATVVLLNTAGSEVARTQTALTGFYYFSPLPPGTYRLVVVHAGFVTQSRDAAVAADVVTTANFALVADGGDPNDYTLVVNIVNANSSLGAVALNDVAMPYVNGVWALTGSSPVVGTVIAAAVGFLPSAPRVVTEADYNGERVFVLNITLEPEGPVPPGILRGFVRVEGTNAPIADATVILFDESGNRLPQTATTDAIGFYSFTGLLPGAYTVTAQHPQHGVRAADEKAVLTLTQGAHINVYLRGQPIVDGFLILANIEPSSAVLAGPTVTVGGLTMYHLDGNTWARNMTMIATFQVAASAPLHINATVSITPADFINNIASVPVRLQRETQESVLQGYVFEQGTQNRVPYASVSVVHNVTGYSRVYQANYDGFFRFEGLDLGSYTLAAWADGFQLAVSPTPVVLVAGVGVHRNIEITRGIQPPGFDLMVAIVGPAPDVVSISMTNGVSLQRVGSSNVWQARGAAMMLGTINVDAPRFRAQTRNVVSTDYDINGEAFIVIVMDELNALIRLFPNYPGGDANFYYEIEMPDIDITIPTALLPTLRRMYGTPGDPGWAFMGWYEEVFANMHYINNPNRITTAQRAERINLLANLVITEAMIGTSGVLELHSTWIRFGDLNGDGIIDPVDRSLMQNRILGSLDNDRVIMETANLNPDVDNIVDPVDRSLLQNHILGAPGIILGHIQPQP